MKTLTTFILMMFVAGCSNMDWGRNRDTTGSGSSGSSYSSGAAPSSNTSSDTHPGNTYEGGQK